VKLFSLHAQNFRNFEKLEFDFAKSVNAFVGKNARGKTNILEAISLLAFGKSFRTSSEKSLRRLGSDFFRIEAVAKNSANEKLRIEIAAMTTAKSFKLNGKKVTASELVGNFPLVSFAPEDLNLLLLAPGLRRRYLDILLAQTSRKYLRSLSKYSKALKNRNVILYQIAENLAKLDELEFWDRELAENGKNRHSKLAIKPYPEEYQKSVRFTRLARADAYEGGRPAARVSPGEAAFSGGGWASSVLRAFSWAISLRQIKTYAMSMPMKNMLVLSTHMAGVGLIRMIRARPMAKGRCRGCVRAPISRRLRISVIRNHTVKPNPIIPVSASAAEKEL